MYYAKDLATGKWWNGKGFLTDTFAGAEIMDEKTKQETQQSLKNILYLVYSNDVSVLVLINEDGDYQVVSRQSRNCSIFETAEFSQLSDALRYAYMIAKDKRTYTVNIEAHLLKYDIIPKFK